MPATSPPSNSQALREVQRAKALHRTVAVITKVDLATSRDRVDQRILGTAPDSVPLPNGCIFLLLLLFIYCLTPIDIGVINGDTVEQQKFTEDQFFQHKYPELWAKEKVGCAALTKQVYYYLLK